MRHDGKEMCRPAAGRVGTTGNGGESNHRLDQYSTTGAPGQLVQVGADYATLDAALEFHRNGLSVLRLPWGAKWENREWKPWQDVAQTKRDVVEMFRHNGRSNIAILQGRPSRNAFAIDCDTPEMFAETGRRLDGLGVETWVVQSNTTAGKHAGGGSFLFRAPVAVASRETFGIRGQGAYIIGYGAHPADLSLYTVTCTDVPIFTLGSLDAFDWLRLVPADPEPKPRPRVPDLAWRLLNADPETLQRFYDPAKGKIDRSDAEHALVCSLVQSGRSFEQIVRLMTAFPGPTKFTDWLANEPEKARGYLWRTYQNAVKFVQEHGTNDAQKRARRLDAWARSRPWPGLTGAVDRAVFLAHCRIVSRSGAEPHGASRRELAELAGVHHETAARANHTLVGAGLLELVETAGIFRAHRWRLVDQDGVQDVEPSEMHKNSNSLTQWDRLTGRILVQTVDRGDDVWRRGALGATGADVWRALLDAGGDGARVVDLARETGRHRNTVASKLKRMFAVGLAEPVDDGKRWRVAPGADLDQAAVQLGTSGKGRQEREKHRRERVVWRRHGSLIFDADQDQEHDERDVETLETCDVDASRRVIPVTVPALVPA